MRKILTVLTAMLLLAGSAAAAPALKNSDVQRILAKTLPGADRVNQLWRGNFKIDPSEEIFLESTEGLYLLVDASSPWKTVAGIKAETARYYSKEAIAKYYSPIFSPPAFKEVDGRLYAFYYGPRDPWFVKWQTKGASIVEQTGSKIAVKARYQASHEDGPSEGVLVFVRENGTWKLNHPVDLPWQSMDDADGPMEPGRRPDYTDDCKAFMTSKYDPEQLDEMLAVFICLGYWDTDDYSTPTPFIKDFVLHHLAGEPEYYLNGTKIFVVIPTHKDTQISVCSTAPDGKTEYAAEKGRTLVFAGNTPKSSGVSRPAFKIKVTCGKETAEFIPDIDLQTERPVPVDDDRIGDLTPEPAAG